MVPDLSAFFQNPYVQGLISFIAEQIMTAGYQRFKDNADNGDSRALLAKQLASCLDRAYCDTCKQFSWEYNDKAIEEVLKKNNELWMDNNLEDRLVKILYQASGADETGIVTKDVIGYWIKCFRINLSCAQELFNYISQERGRDIVENFHADSTDYQDAFNEKLFLETVVDDGKFASLKDVYIQPRYKTKTVKGEKTVEVASMLKSFFSDRDRFTIQQDDDFPVIAKKIFAIMILGKPGSGKSSFISYLSHAIPEEFPLRRLYIIRLRNLTSAQINNDDPIQGLLDYMQTERSALEKSILILDGLDEICAMYHRTDFHSYLKKLLHALSNVQGLQLVITSRHGYFRIDDSIEHYCLIVNIENWDNGDLERWSSLYADIHPGLDDVIRSNKEHLKEEKYSDKKAIFAVPILFYMANARGELLSRHKNVCSVYDAVLTEVAGARHYDSAAYTYTGDLIPPNLARQICMEIAFAMFRNGRLSLIDQADPYLAPDEVAEAINDAIQICYPSGFTIKEEDKKKIKDFYALTFYYSRHDSSVNAVEFAHKTIAEYFTAEKIISLLNNAQDSITKEELCELLSECFGYAPITADIFLFLYEKIQLFETANGISRIKQGLEKHFIASVLDGSLFSKPKKYDSAIHIIDRVPVMMRSVLLLFEYLQCLPPALEEDQKAMFNSVIASISRISPLRSQHQSLLPIALNGFDLEGGDFTSGEFSESHFSGANLTHTNFSDANMVDAQMSGSIIDAADFSGANLAGADLSGIEKCDAADFTQASLQGADLSRSKFIRTSFEQAEMQEAVCEECIFGEACSFEEAILYLAKLDDADISLSNIQGALFNDDEIEAEEAEEQTISRMKLTREQYQYLSTVSGVKLIDETLVD